MVSSSSAAGPSGTRFSRNVVSHYLPEETAPPPCPEYINLADYYSQPGPIQALDLAKHYSSPPSRPKSSIHNATKLPPTFQTPKSTIDYQAWMQERIREKLAELERIKKLKNGMIFYGGDGEKKMDKGSLVVKVGEDWRDENEEEEGYGFASEVERRSHRSAYVAPPYPAHFREVAYPFVLREERPHWKGEWSTVGEAEFSNECNRRHRVAPDFQRRLKRDKLKILEEVAEEVPTPAPNSQPESGKEEKGMRAQREKPLAAKLPVTKPPIAKPPVAKPPVARQPVVRNKSTGFPFGEHEPKKSRLRGIGASIASYIRPNRNRQLPSATSSHDPTAQRREQPLADGEISKDKLDVQPRTRNMYADSDLTQTHNQAKKDS